MDTYILTLGCCFPIQVRNMMSQEQVHIMPSWL